MRRAPPARQACPPRCLPPTAPAPEAAHCAWGVALTMYPALWASVRGAAGALRAARAGLPAPPPARPLAQSPRIPASRERGAGDGLPLPGQLCRDAMPWCATPRGGGGRRARAMAGAHGIGGSPVRSARCRCEGGAVHACAARAGLPGRGWVRGPQQLNGSDELAGAGEVGFGGAGGARARGVVGALACQRRGLGVRRGGRRSEREVPVIRPRRGRAAK